MSGRQKVYGTEAVVLRRMNLGEADRLLTLFSPDEGKIKAMAKGVRRPGSRKAGHLEPFTRAKLLLARGRDLDIITQAEAIDLYSDLQRDLVRLGYAAYVVELLDRFTVQEGESRSLYDLLVATLSRLSAVRSPDALVRYFELRLLDLVGYRPELSRCLSCGGEIQPESQFFSAQAGGVLCPKCGRSRHEANPVSLAALKVLRHYQRNLIEEALAPSVSLEVHGELERLMHGYLTYLLERKLNSPAFLDRVRQLPADRVNTDLSI